MTTGAPVFLLAPDGSLCLGNERYPPPAIRESITPFLAQLTDNFSKMGTLRTIRSSTHTSTNPNRESGLPSLLVFPGDQCPHIQVGLELAHCRYPTLVHNFSEGKVLSRHLAQAAGLICRPHMARLTSQLISWHIPRRRHSPGPLAWTANPLPPAPH